MLEIARTLVNAGHETWCVGGAVRDALIGNPHLDWDLATSAPPPVVQRLFRRTIPVGIRFGTVGVLDRTGRMHEVTTFRRDFNADGRHAEVEFGVSLHDDLARRDFTINAMAWDPIGHRLEDPFDGRGDLVRGVVRAVGDPDARFEEDRLRALRAIRFASRFGFVIEDATWHAIVRSAPHFGRLSAERVKQELDKTMEQVVRPSEALRRWRESGAFATLAPALTSLEERHLLATDAMALPGPSSRPLRRTLRFAALLSGLESRSLQRLLKDLKFSNMEMAGIVSLTDNWKALGDAMAARLISRDAPPPATAPQLTGPGEPDGRVVVARPELPGPSVPDGRVAIARRELPDRDVRRWVARIGRLRVAAFGRLAQGIWWADRELGKSSPSPRSIRMLHRQMLRIAFTNPLDIADLAIDGEMLTKLGVAPGPSIGRTLRALVDVVLDDPARNTPPSLAAEVARLQAGERGDA